MIIHFILYNHGSLPMGCVALQNFSGLGIRSHISMPIYWSDIICTGYLLFITANHQKPSFSNMWNHLRKTAQPIMLKLQTRESGNHGFRQWPCSSSFWRFPFSSLQLFTCSVLKEPENKKYLREPWVYTFNTLDHTTLLDSCPLPHNQ